MISTSDVMKLRNSTGAGMMDCKNALEEAGGDMNKAADLLRKKGIIKAAKRADKVAAEGVVAGYVTSGGKSGALVEINSETDFVAKSDDFIQFSKLVTQLAAEQSFANLEQLNAAKLPSGQTVAEMAQNLTLKIGEKITVRRFTRYESVAGQIYLYLHGAKIGVLTEMTGGDKELGMDVAMHTAAANPKALDRSGIPASLVNSEKEIYAEQLRQQNKPANIIENIVKGKLDKFYSEVCLLEQQFIKDEELKIEQLLAKKQGSVVRFARYELGEGIEKQTKDFAAEVAEQLK